MAKKALDGQLSSNQIASISGVVEVDSSLEKELVDTAGSASLFELKKICTKAKLEAVGPDVQRKKIHKKRYFKCFTDEDGMRHLCAGGNPEYLMYIEQAVATEREVIFKKARSNGRRDTFENYGFDAFINVVTEAASSTTELPPDCNHPGTDSGYSTCTPATEPPTGHTKSATTSDITDAAAGIAGITGATVAGSGITGAAGITGITGAGAGNPLPTPPTAKNTSPPPGTHPSINVTHIPALGKLNTINQSLTSTSDRHTSPPPAKKGDEHTDSPTQKRDTKKAKASYKIIIRIDHCALLRGYTQGDEVSEISGVGPIAPSVVREIINNDDPFIAMVITKLKEVSSVVHLGRKPTASQVTALEWMYPTCAVKGCECAIFLEIDHRKPWADTHKTTLTSLDRLCSYHHDLKTNFDWQLVEGTGKRDFVPPDNPRHPSYKSKRPDNKPGNKPGYSYRASRHQDGDTPPHLENKPQRQNIKSNLLVPGNQITQITGLSTEGKA